MSLSNLDMIKKAEAKLNSKQIGDYLVGNVACALLAEDDNLYFGVCMDVSSGIGFCAEHSAIAAMVTAGEYKIKKIVAVWNSDGKGLHVMSPCGRCREFMNQIHEDNIHDTEVILDVDQSVKLSELLPYHDWFHKIDG